ncbi:energy transducer TonB [Adhaeribacter soli]|uniref:TonB family protein n=1 Tax=Adhaeribacter soli TaxID=2607655 RepID=A0A5N1J9Q5_9BACT|nr:energy transducer TonB [Adhaeribacter soli]KAA9345559.1 TonB family protein [Adhaeribacter soli]
MKKNLLALFILLASGLSSNTQARQTKPQNLDKVYVVAEQMPVFPGGEAAIKQYFDNALATRKFTTSGTVTLSLVIDKTGQPKDIEVGTGISTEANAFVLETAKKMPKWQPGRQKGQPVNVRLNLPVTVPMPERVETEEEKNLIFVSVEQSPEFPGGFNVMYEYFGKSIIYPPAAQKNKIEGRVMAQFVVWKDGLIKEPKILRGLSPEIDAEALRVIKAMPKWKPGKQNGREVNVRMVIPINFKLAEPAEKNQPAEKK